MSKITASIVLYNTPDDQLSRLLECIGRSGILDQVYLIDNSPESFGGNRHAQPWIVYIRPGANVGYGAGHNIALRQVMDESEFHFILNPDVYFGPQELGKMIARMREDGAIGQLMPRVVYPDGRLQYLCKLIPTPADLFIRRFLRGPLRAMAQKKAERFELRFTGYGREMDIPFLSGCFMLFRTSALKRIGLFDERFFMYAEDIDITRRMHAEYRTVFFPGATIAHDHAQASYKSGKMLFIHLANLIRYFNKWGWIFDARRKEVNASTIRALRER
jgi:GT2 family glycosyltransferase